MKTQLEKLKVLLRRKRGVTAMEIVSEVGTVCPHKRLSELKEQGWTITRNVVCGRSYGRYFGSSPKGC